MVKLIILFYYNENLTNKITLKFYDTLVLKMRLKFSI